MAGTEIGREGRRRATGTRTSPGTASTSPAWEISLGRAEAFQLTAHGVVLLFLGVGVFSAVADVDTSTVDSVLLVGAFVATVAVHELVHALCFWLFGGSPRFGAGIASFLPYVSTTCEGNRFDTQQMSVIGLAPLVSLSVVSLAVAGAWPTLAPYALVAFLANLTGSVGDIWLVATVRRFARLEDVTFEDRAAGVAVWTDDEDAAGVVEPGERGGGAVSRFLARFAVATVVVFVVTAVVGLFVTFVLPGDQAFRIGPAAVPLFEKQPDGDGVLVSLSFGPPVVAGLLFAALSMGLRRLQR